MCFIVRVILDPVCRNAGLEDLYPLKEDGTIPYFSHKMSLLKTGPLLPRDRVMEVWWWAGASVLSPGNQGNRCLIHMYFYFRFKITSSWVDMAFLQSQGKLEPVF